MKEAGIVLILMTPRLSRNATAKGVVFIIRKQPQGFLVHHVVMREFLCSFLDFQP
jgi:hypothetical protein